MSPQNDTPQNNDDHEQDTIELSNGRSVPKSAVDALRVLDEKWPGATLRIARPAIVAAVLDALHVDGFKIVKRTEACIQAAKTGMELIGKQPDVVAVKLPEPSYVDEPEVGAKGYGFNGDAGDRHLSERGVYAHDGMVYDQWDSVSPDDARKIGSWWLAAAARAEAADGAQ